MNTTPGIVWPQRGKAVYQEDLDFEQISKDDAIVNRTADHYSHGVQFGGEVTIAGAGLISVGPTLAYDIDGKRIHHPSSQSVIVPDGSWIVALRHEWSMSDGVDPDLSGTSVQYRNDSYVIVLRAAAQPGDIPLRSVTFAAGVGTLGADLRSLRAMTVAGDAEVGGDLDVHGHATLHGGATIIGDPVYVDSENVRTKDNEIVLNEGESGAGITAGISGIRMKRGSLADALLRFVESDDRFYAGIDGALEKLAYLSEIYTKAQLDASFEGESGGKKLIDWAHVLNKPAVFASLTPGMLYGATVSANGASPNTKLDVTAGYATDSTITALLTIPAWTLDLSAAWAAGNGSGKLVDTGALAPSTTYHIFAIRNADGTVQDFCVSPSLTPTLPGGCTLKRRIGSRQTNASGNLIPVIQQGQWHTYKDIQIPLDGVAISTAGALYAVGVPTGIKVIASGILLGGHGAAGSGLMVSITSPDGNDQTPVYQIGTGFRGATFGYANGTFENYSLGQIHHLTDASGQLRMHRIGTYGSAAHQTTLQIVGYYDDLGIGG